MKNYVKFAIVGLAGYFIGFYECRYKIQKVLLETIVEANEKKEVKESEEA